MCAKKRVIDDNHLRVVFYLTLLLLLFPPFFRGLFFDYEFGVARIYAGLVLAAYAFIRRDQIRLSRNIMDYAWIGLICAYIISNFVALNQRAALESVLRYFTFFAIFWLLARTIGNLRDFKTAFAVIFTAGVGVALAGLGTAFGTFSFNGAFSENMILSTLQYHNAAAIFMVATGCIGLYLAAYVENFRWRIAIGGLNYIVIATAYGAGSRGAMMVAPVGFLLLIAGMPKEYRFKVFINFISVLVPFILTAKQVLEFSVHGEGYYWGWLLIGIVLACGCQYLVEKLMSTSAEVRKRVIAGIGIAVVALGVALIIFLGSTIMPESIAARLSNLDLQSVNVQERFYFYRDAMELIKDNPVFGVGGGGWNSAYNEYQSYLYFSTEVHNHPLQVWVESGTLGFIFYLTLWVGLAVSTFRVMTRVSSPEYRSLAWTAAVTAVTICLHSLIDFSLSLGSVAIIMWACTGIVRAAERLCFEEDRIAVKPLAGPVFRRVSWGILAAVLFLISTSLYLAEEGQKQAMQVISGDTQAAVDKLAQSTRYDPLNSNYYLYLAQLYSNMAYQRQDFNLATKAMEYAEKAVSLNEKSVHPMWPLAQIYISVQRPAEAVIMAEKAVAAAPWKQEGYEALGDIYNAAAQMYIQMGQKDQAKQLLRKTTNIPQLTNQQMAKLDPDARRLWVRAPLLSVTEKIRVSVDEANRLLKTL